METSLTVYFELPLKLQKEVGYIKKNFIQHGSEYHSSPHISLYTASFSKPNFIKFLDKIKRLRFNKFIFTILSIRNRERFFSINILKTKEILNIHRKILDLAGPLHNKNLRASYFKRLKEGKFSKKELQLLHKYGTAMALEYFAPHITLGAVPLDVSESKLKDLYKRSNKALSHIKGRKYLVDKIILIFKKRLKSGQKKIVFRKSISLN